MELTAILGNWDGGTEIGTDHEGSSIGDTPLRQVQDYPSPRCDTRHLRQSAA